MQFLSLQSRHREKIWKYMYIHSRNLTGVYLSLLTDVEVEDVSDKYRRKGELAKNLALLVEESNTVDTKRPKSRMELKKSFEFQIKKKVKAMYKNGKFQNLTEKVIANPSTLQEAYNCIRINSNVDTTLNDDTVAFESMAEELCDGIFDIKANTFTISTKGLKKEQLVLPKLKLNILQEAIRIVLEVVFRPCFSKISHGCRTGRGHCSALKYISKGISNPDWWFAIQLNKKMDACILNQLISVMEDKIEDPKLFSLIRNMFDAQVINLEFGGFPKGHGLPQEGVLSAILMNIYLNLFDYEFYKLSMKYEALSSYANHDGSHSNLRNWFRRQMRGNDPNYAVNEKPNVQVHCCRVMDEIFLAVSGSKDIALSFKAEILNYLQYSLHLDTVNQEEIVSCSKAKVVRFVGTLLRRSVKENSTLKSVHKLKEKVELFAFQKQEVWNNLTVRIGKKWLGHGLKKVKESEIPHLSNNGHSLSQISSFRKSGMETDHWYKFLLKIWMQDIKAREAECEEIILSKFVAEPALPPGLKESFYEFQRCAKSYVSLEAASALALVPNAGTNTKSFALTVNLAPVVTIRKCLSRYGLTTSRGYARMCSLLILQDNSQIVDWYSGLVSRWLRWYHDCDNFNEIKAIICEQVRKSCIRTLAAKHRIAESEIEKRFDSELSRIPLLDELENGIEHKREDTLCFDSDEALMYGMLHGGLCLLSLARMVSQSRQCNCFVIGCLAPAPSVYNIHVMERQKFPGWKTGFAGCIHPSLNRRRIGLCRQHLQDLYLGHISLQAIDFGAWK